MANAKYWVGICYPENMVDNWQVLIGDLLQVPFCYCIHDKDLLKDGDETRKIHVHIMLAFSNTTTQKHALNTLNRLSINGRLCCSTIEQIVSVRKMYDYLIHDTETCRKLEKHLYSPEERISGNCFDIGSYEQLSIVEKTLMARELCDFIMNNCICNFGDFYVHVITHFDTSYFEVLKGHSGLFERLTKANYQKKSSR